MWAGNAAADSAAKARAERLRPAEFWRNLAEQQEKARDLFLRRSAKLLALYPALRQFGGQPDADEAHDALATLELVRGRELVWVQGRRMHVCLACGRSCHSWRRGGFEATACPR